MRVTLQDYEVRIITTVLIGGYSKQGVLLNREIFLRSHFRMACLGHSSGSYFLIWMYIGSFLVGDCKGKGIENSFLKRGGRLDILKKSLRKTLVVLISTDIFGGEISACSPARYSPVVFPAVPLRGSSAVERQVHDLEVVGSSPALATGFYNQAGTRFAWVSLPLGYRFPIVGQRPISLWGGCPALIILINWWISRNALPLPSTPPLLTLQHTPAGAGRYRRSNELMQEQPCY